MIFCARHDKNINTEVQKIVACFKMSADQSQNSNASAVPTTSPDKPFEREPSSLPVNSAAHRACFEAGRMRSQ